MTDQQIIIIVIVFIVCSFILLLVTYFMQLRETRIEDKIKQESIKCGFFDKTTKEIKKQTGCDFLLKKYDVDCYVKVLNVPTKSQVVLNYKDTVCLHYGGTKQKGTLYPNKKYLKLDKFLSSDIKGIKMLLIYPSTNQVMMYVNECEMIHVKACDFPYNMKLVKFEDLNEALDSIYSKEVKSSNN